MKHAQGIASHETESEPSAIASNDATSDDRPVVPTSTPVPCAVILNRPALRPTETVPLSTQRPCATSPSMKRTATTAPRAAMVSPRSSKEKSPAASESPERNQTSTPLPPWVPRISTPLPAPPAARRHRPALAGASKRTVSRGGWVTCARSRAAGCSELPEAVAATASAHSAGPGPLRGGGGGRGGGDRGRAAGRPVPGAGGGE